jgi:pantoate--beta-alanine ligase
MGALHGGHLSLIEAAKKTGAFTVVSIYVNPTQFGPHEDYQKYPRTLDVDCATCAKAGVDVVFSPSDAETYPPGDQTRVRPGPLADTLCGPFRPGHFEGVCTVVAKLFNIVQPDVAYFGQKDAQQALIIRRMVEDLHLSIRIEVCPIAREADGLALSSRNVRLSPLERRQALCLYRALDTARERLRAGERRIGGIVAAMRAVISEHSEISVDYLSIVDPGTLEPIAAPSGQMLVAGAIRIGGTRLIDNVMVELPQLA